MILVTSNCFLSATVSASYRVDLDELASLWLLVILSGTSDVGLDRWVRRGLGSANALGGSDLALFQVEMVAYKVEDLFGVQFRFLHVDQPAKLLQITTRVCVCWRKVWWDMALTNQSSMYWSILIPKPVVTVFPIFCPEGSATGLESAGPDQP